MLLSFATSHCQGLATGRAELLVVNDLDILNKEEDVPSGGFVAQVPARARSPHSGRRDLLFLLGAVALGCSSARPRRAARQCAGLAGSPSISPGGRRATNFWGGGFCCGWPGKAVFGALARLSRQGRGVGSLTAPGTLVERFRRFAVDRRDPA